MVIPDDPGRRGVVGVAVRDGRMLVIRRSRTVVAPLVYCFPGGGIEAGESEQQALVREFCEEIGVAVRPLRRLWECVTAWKVELAWWLVELPPDATPVPNPAEVESIHWYSPEEMSQLPDLLESNREFLEFGRQSHLFSNL
jgi:8-oxo-dGTP pyrophosphatase MutT (NUDIX family)